MYSFHPLNLHPIARDTRRLVKDFEYQVQVLVSNGTQNRPESLKASADIVAGTIVGDGRISDGELKVLAKVKAQLNPENVAALDHDGLAELQAKRNVYDLLDVNFEKRTIADQSANLTAAGLPQHPLLPSSRKMLEALNDAATNVGIGHSYDAELKRAISRFAGDDRPSGRQTDLAREVAVSAREICEYLKTSKDDQAFHVWRDQFAVISRMAEDIARMGR